MNFTLSDKADWENLFVCRCCLKKDCDSLNFTETHDFGKNGSFEEMFRDTFNIQNNPEMTTDKQYVCEECASKMQAASDFKNMVMQNQEAYLEFIQNTKGTASLHPEIKMENIKMEVALESVDLDITYHEDGDSYNDDDEIPANYELGTKSRVGKKLTRSSESKGRKCKMKPLETEYPQDGMVKKNTDYRGTGPSLRENSLKLLENSTACVFQWNRSWYCCFCCKEPFSDIALLKIHTKKHHTIADIEKKIISQQNRLVKVEVTALECRKCNERCTLDELTTHLMKHEINVEEHLLVPFKIDQNLTCQICYQPFNLFRLLNIHMNMHYQKHVCHVCGSGFSNLVFLNLHRSRSHRVIRCGKCDVSFPSKGEKKRHDTGVHGVKFETRHRYPCPHCPERFPQENPRVKHMIERHDLVKPEFRCGFCSKCFITKSLVNNHVKIVHMKERKHECDVCHHRFYSKSDVSRHRVTHTGEKNFFCGVCSSPFASKDSLRRHTRRTHV